MPVLSSPSRAQRYGFLLLPQFSLSSFGLAADVLMRANQLAEQPLYELLTLSLHSNETVRASCGLPWRPDLELAYAPRLDALFVIGVEAGPDTETDDLARGLGQLVPQPALIGALGTASWWLARAGLLEGYRATIHWQEIHRFAESFPHVVVSSNLFEIDRDRATCAGGAATLDFMLALISQTQGNDFVAQLSELFSMERMRPGNERQRIPLATRIGGSQPKLTEAVALMEANIEEPLSTDDIAYYVGLSRRQLERLFKQYLNTVPSRYYLELRLNRARQLLQQTSKSIVQIGLSCGFSSGPHFSSTYRNHFGITPREERSVR